MKFPLIQGINDVLPFAEGHDEITVMRKDDGAGAFYTVVNYMHQTNSTFANTPEGRYRREFRGLIFDADGRLISRPFHKFFNLGEKEEVSLDSIDWSRPHVVQEKMDGSMVRPFMLHGKRVWGTKAGLTEVAQEAEDVFAAKDVDGAMSMWVDDQLAKARTPIFEYIGPKNRIVVGYQEADIVYLALRDNLTGEYVQPETPFPGSRVPEYGSVSEIDAYVAKVRGDTGREGDVVLFEDGTRIKIKSEWYVEIHGIKETLAKDRYIALQALDETLDDALAVLQPEERPIVIEKADAFIRAYMKKKSFVEGLVRDVDAWTESYDGDNMRKSLALEFVPALPRKEDSKYVFFHVDGKDALAAMESDVRRKLQKDSRYDEMMEWLSA